MALVGYSDSEESDNEADQAVVAPASKRIERSEGNKLKVSLATFQTAKDEPAEPATKRQRTGGTFAGFNSLLPPPKRAASAALKPGINLRTSSEAAFSRRPPPRVEDEHNDKTTIPAAVEDQVEPTLVGKPTRFMPLSVSRTQQKKKKVPLPAVAPASTGTELTGNVPAPTLNKTRKSLFSMAGHEDAVSSGNATAYEPEFVHSANRAVEPAAQEQSASTTQPLGPLQSVATDMNLSESDRRRLFGRTGAGNSVSIAHFDMNAEYQSNQELAARGEMQEHKTVRAIAPGRHSLQQLVNNVKGQTEAIEDKWAEGRRARGETGSKYGW